MLGKHKMLGRTTGISRRRGRSPVRWRVPLIRRIARRPAFWWLLVGACAVWTAVTTSAVLADARQEQLAWGESMTVLAAAVPIAEGETLDGRVELVSVPRGLVPDNPLRTVPVTATATTAIAAGELLTGLRVRLDTAPTTEWMPSGTLAMAVPSGYAGSGVEPGDRVDIFATFNPLPGQFTAAGETVIVASGATVLSVDDGSVMVAVSRSEASDLAGASAVASLTVALVDPG